MQWTIIVLLVLSSNIVTLAVALALHQYFKHLYTAIKSWKPPEPTVHPDLNKIGDIYHKSIQIDKALRSVPSKVLESITSSANNYKGNLGELIGYLQLNGKYDKLVPWSNVTDFIGIRWPTEDEKGQVDFIDIKNGPNAKLTKDQQRLKKVIKDGQINFVKVKVQTEV